MLFKHPDVLLLQFDLNNTGKFYRANCYFILESPIVNHEKIFFGDIASVFGRNLSKSFMKTLIRVFYTWSPFSSQGSNSKKLDCFAELEKTIYLNSNKTVQVY